MGDPQEAKLARGALGVDSESVYMTADPNFVWEIASATPSNASISRVAIVMEKSQPALHGWCSRQESLLMIFAQDQTTRSLSIPVLLNDIATRATCRDRSPSCRTMCLCRTATNKTINLVFKSLPLFHSRLCQHAH